MSRTMALALAWCAALAVPPAAQEQARPVYRIGSELVVVDLVATDRSGNTVGGIEPSEIKVFQNGKEQKIEFVRLVKSGWGTAPVAEPAGGAIADAPRSAAPSAETPPTGTSGSDVHVAIVLDLGSMPPDTFPRVREAILQMVREELPQGAAVMVATLTPAVTIRQPFTADRAAIVAAVNALPLPSGGGLTLAEVVEKTESACDLAGVDGLQKTAVAVARSLVVESRSRLTAGAHGLAALSRHLAALEGRKHVVLYSAGYFTNPISDAAEAVTAAVSACTGVDTAQLQRSIAQDLVALSADDVGIVQNAIDRANRGQVSLYAVDPRGLIGRDLGVKLNPERVAELLASGSRLEIRTDVDLPKRGKYQIVVVARDSSGWIAARSVDVTVQP